MPACLRPSSPRQFPEGASGSHTWFSFRSMLAAARVELILDGSDRQVPAGGGFGHLPRTDWLPDFRLAAGEVTGTAPMPPIHRGTTKPRSCRPFVNGSGASAGATGAVMTRSAVPGLLHRLPGHGISRVASKSRSWPWRGLYRSRQLVAIDT